MKIDFILDAMYLFVFIVCFIISVITGKSIVESGWSFFFFGATVALAARNVANELSQRAERRLNRRRRLR